MVGHLAFQYLHYHGPLVAEHNSTGRRVLGGSRSGCVGDQTDTLTIGVLSMLDDAGDQDPQLGPEGIRNPNAHLCHVGPKCFIGSLRDIDRDSRELAVLVQGPKPIPSSTLNQAIVAIDVEPLLTIPSVGPTGELMGLLVAEVVLRGENIGLDADLELVPVVLEIKALDGKVLRHRLGLRERVPWLHRLFVEKYSKAPGAGTPGEKSVEHHAELKTELLRGEGQLSAGGVAIGFPVAENPIQFLPHHDGSHPVFKRLNELVSAIGNPRPLKEP